MAETLSTGIVIPQGTDAIPSNGVEHDRILGTTANTAIEAARFPKGRITTNADAFTLGPAIYTISSVAYANMVENLPEKLPGTLVVYGNEGQPVKAIEFKPYDRDYTWETSANTLSGGFRPWTRPGMPFLGQDPGLMHHMAREQFARRRGGTIGTGGLPVVALRWDHGLGNFRDLILPHLVRLGLPGSLAMNSGAARWALPETGGVTAATLNGWAVDHGIEIWNHGQTHTDASTLTDLTREIATGKTELQGQVPSVPVEGWVIPGVSGTGYGGFSAGETPAHWDTIAGRLILAHHGAATSHIDGTMAPLDGRRSVISRHFGVDSSTAALAKAEIDDLIDYGTGGTVIFLHPSVLNATDRITSAQYVEILEYIAAKRDAGQIMVLTMGGLSVADQDRISRPASAPILNRMAAGAALTAGGFSRTKTLDARRLWVRGAVRMITVSLTISTPGTVTVQTGDAAVTTHTVAAGAQTIRRPVTIPLTATSLAVTVKSGTAAGTVTQIIDSPV